jgi:putative ABC transport system permease protein
MIAVTGVSLGLASQSVVQSEGVDYWIVPEQAGVESIAISTGGPRLGDVHETSRQIRSDPDVTYATPVLLELVPVREATTGERTYVLAAGIVPEPGQKILGLPTNDLTPGDPHYANGTYDGPRTNEAILNTAAAEVTNTSMGDRLTFASANRSLQVLNVTQGNTETVAGNVPVMLVHLSELQTLTGGDSGDTADQLLVSTTEPAVRDRLTDRYPRTTVVTREGLSAQQVSASNLPLAVAITAVVSTVVVGVLFITTLMGLEVSADRNQLGALTAIGFSRRSLSLLVASETVGLSLVGGLVGIVVGFGGVLAANVLGERLFGVGSVAVFEPRLAALAVGVALAIGIIGALYPVWLTRRSDALAVLQT